MGTAMPLVQVQQAQTLLVLEAPIYIEGKFVRVSRKHLAAFLDT